MKTKICNKCKKEKLVTGFYKDNKSKDGLRYYCKKCGSKYYRGWYLKNKEKIFIKAQQWKRINPIKYWCQNTIRQHKCRGYKILFKYKDLLPIAKKTKYCSICEVKLDWNCSKGKIQYNSPTLDRVNNEKTLSLDNTQILCRRCNTMKSDNTMKEFVYYCKMVGSKYDNNL